MIRIGTTLTWETKNGPRRARVYETSSCLVFARDTAGKPVEFLVNSLRKLIRQGVVKVDRHRRYRIARLAIPGMRAARYLRTSRIERALRKRPQVFKRKTHLRLTPVANAGDF